MTHSGGSYTQLELAPDGRTKVERKREMEYAAVKLRCPKCGAPPNEPCSTENGEATAPHKARMRQATYR